jgi:UDP-N-acetylmuramate--alanine ligase
MNALAAAGAAWMLGIPGEAVSIGLSTFSGADRRLQFKGNYNGADIYDDYAHHPDELAATIDAVRTMGYKRMIVAFQPHTYTRTKALFSQFVEQLQKPDLVILGEIYAAREQNILGISSLDLQKEIPGSVYCQTLPEITDYLRDTIVGGDVVLTVGAGDIFRVADALIKE